MVMHLEESVVGHKQSAFHASLTLFTFGHNYTPTRRVVGILEYPSVRSSVPKPCVRN